MDNLYFMAWWMYALMDASYQENYWEAVAANQTWYNVLHHLTETPRNK